MKRADFEDWLLRFRPHTIVGTAGSALRCPLAKWSGYDVGHTTYHDTPEMGSPERPLPQWAQAFVAAIDCFSGDDITCERARHYLSLIP